MDVGTYTPKALFKKDIRYEIPTFQRPYVWNQEDQWEPLWDDVRNVAERYMDNLEHVRRDNAANHDTAGEQQTAAQKRTAPHFMGAVVLQQQANAIADLETRQVIDGQQRITTLQIMLDAAQEVFARLGASGEAKRLLGLVENQLVERDADKWKLWPTALDRDAFVAAMSNDLSPDGFESSPIVQAHDFFRLQMTEWLEDFDEGDLNVRAHALETTLMGLLNVVGIDLASSDDSFVIFETLNARGTPLNQSDLIKNFVLQREALIGRDADELHRRTWLALETPYWRQEVTQGRIKRPRLDLFINYWLAMRTGEDVTANNVFPSFKRSVETNNLDVASTATDLRTAADRYIEFENSRPGSRIGTFLYRWNTMQAGASTPLILWLCSHLDEDDPELEQALITLEDFLVRRMICRGTTKDYNRLFLDAVQFLDQNVSSAASAALRRFLTDQAADSRVWPSNADVSNALLDLPLYRLLTRGRLRFVLEAMEDARRTPFADEKQVDRRNLTIEHLMPQSWAAHWPMPEGDDPEEARRQRERLLHTVGNLVLLDGKLNTDVSNGPWSVKVQGLEEHSTMLLTRDLVREYGNEQWNESLIHARSRALANSFCEIWPGPRADELQPNVAQAAVRSSEGQEPGTSSLG